MPFTCAKKGSSNDLRKLKKWVEVECTLHCCPISSEMCNSSTPFQQVFTCRASAYLGN